MQKLIFATVMLGILALPASARVHPHPDNYLPIDIAAQPTYPAAIAIAPRHRRHHISKRHRHHVKYEAIYHKSEPKKIAAKTASEASKVIHHRPYRMRGVLTIGSKTFDYVSGGAGRGSIPYGDHPIDDSQGSWGSRHGALGLAGGEIYDPELGRKREGIELHAGHSRTLGCVGIKNWRELKKLILAMENKFGRAVLHIWPDGVSITPNRHVKTAVLYIPERIATKHRALRRHRLARI